MYDAATLREQTAAGGLMKSTLPFTMRTQYVLSKERIVVWVWNASWTLSDLSTWFPSGGAIPGGCMIGTQKVEQVGQVTGAAGFRSEVWYPDSHWLCASCSAEMCSPPLVLYQHAFSTEMGGFSAALIAQTDPSVDSCQGFLSQQ